MGLLTGYLHAITSAYPDLVVHTATLDINSGQFNAIVLINDNLIFRFPRSAYVAEHYPRQIALLSYLRDKLPLSIPDPQYISLPDVAWQHRFMGYERIPGAPFYREIIDTIGDSAAVQALATQLASFLRSLHQVSLADLPVDLPLSDRVEDWVVLYQDIRTLLFPYMRQEAHREVAKHFEHYLNDPAQYAYQPVLRHGDFGDSNILYDSATQRMSGIIDFESLALGDPATDVAPLVGYGEDFLNSCLESYPAMQTMLERVRFYRGTYALQEAWYGLRDGNQQAFERGIAPYR
jgi:aminoglycoside 2''-phosphotransferase